VVALWLKSMAKSWQPHWWCIFAPPRFWTAFSFGPIVRDVGGRTALVSEVANGLFTSDGSRLVSYVWLANAPSLAWHRRFGFREIPTLEVATRRAALPR